MIIMLAAAFVVSMQSAQGAVPVASVRDDSQSVKSEPTLGQMVQGTVPAARGAASCILSAVDPVNVYGKSFTIDVKLKEDGNCGALGTQLVFAISEGGDGATYRIPATKLPGIDNDEPSHRVFRLAPGPGLPNLQGSWEVFEGATSQATARLTLINLENVEPVGVTVTARYKDYPELDRVLVDDSLAVAPKTAAAAEPSKPDVVNSVSLRLPSSLLLLGNTWKVETQDGLQVYCASSGGAWGTSCDNVNVDEIRINALEESSKPRKIVLSKNTSRIEVTIAGRSAVQGIPLPMVESAFVTCPRNKDNTAVQRAVEDGNPISANDEAMRSGACRMVLSKDELRLEVVERYPELGEIRRVRKEEDDAEDCQCSAGSDHIPGEDIACVDNASTRGASERQLAAACLDGLRKVDKFIALHGPQRLQMDVVQLGKSASDLPAKSLVYKFYSAERRAEVLIPFPESDLDPQVPYSVSLSNQTGLSEHASSETSAERIAVIRPRGRFGWPTKKSGKSVRVYLTLPVSLTTLQFPASGRDLVSTSDSRWLQQTSFDFGVLLVIEPWDYNHGANAWALPVLFTAGILNRGLSASAGSDPAFRQPFFVTGPEISFPLLRGRKFSDVTAALGFLYGMDLREERPLRQGSHFLLTLGFNIFSLLGAPSSN